MAAAESIILIYREIHKMSSVSIEIIILYFFRKLFLRKWFYIPTYFWKVVCSHNAWWFQIFATLLIIFIWSHDAFKFEILSLYILKVSIPADATAFASPKNLSPPKKVSPLKKVFPPKNVSRFLNGVIGQMCLFRKICLPPKILLARNKYFSIIPYIYL